MLHLIKGLDVEEAIFDVVVLVLLVRKRRAFYAVGDPGGPQRAGVAALEALVGLIVYGLVAIAVHDTVRGIGVPSVRSAADDAVRHARPGRRRATRGASSTR